MRIPKLSVITGKASKEAPINGKAICKNCKTSMFLPVIMNPRINNGKLDRRTGTTVLVCLHCREIHGEK